MTRYRGVTDAGTQLLVTVREDDVAEVSTRANDWDTWSRPTFAELVPDEGWDS